MSGNTIRVLLADDHNVLREGLRALLDRETDIEVVADVPDGRAAVRKAGELLPDVVVMDIGMPGLDGVEATREILSSLSGPRVLCLSVHREEHVVRSIFEAGASGYLLKTSASEELLQAVRAVAKGDSYLSPPLVGDLIARHMRPAMIGEEGSGQATYSELTPREREVLRLSAEGLHTKRIAAHLGIAQKTVLAHRANLMRKIGADSVADLVRYALRQGVIEL